MCGSTLRSDSHITLVHTSATVARRLEKELSNKCLAHKENWKFESGCLPLRVPLPHLHQGLSLHGGQSSAVCSTVGPSASMGVPAPYQNSALVASVELMEHPASPEIQPLSSEEEELLINNLDMCTMTSGACWYVTAEVEATPVEFLIDPGAMVTALSVELKVNISALGKKRTRCQ